MDFASLKRPELIKLLKEAGLDFTGNKQALVDRLQAHFSSTTNTVAGVVRSRPEDDDDEEAETVKKIRLDQDKKEEEDDDIPDYSQYEVEESNARPTDLYLDTINRASLDFDFEKVCSVTLSHVNIYACLVCGKYFQGRGYKTPASAHSVSEDHHVYINLSTQKVYILPDNYEVDDPSLDDIKYLLFPTFTSNALETLDRSLTPSYDLHHEPYYPGFVGLNNIKSNSFMNCVLHALIHVIPLRNYFILDPLPNARDASELVKRFSMLCRKVWNPRAFKGQVSPHEILQECANVSNKRFKTTEAGDPIEFLGWLLNQLHRDLGGNRKSRSSIIYSCFQGELRISEQKIIPKGSVGGKPQFDIDPEVQSSKSPFVFLTLDLPPPPLFQDANKENIVPQVSIVDILAKYDGKTTQELKGSVRRCKLTRLPPFVILYVKRFIKNDFVEEKNPTIVNFPLKGIDMGAYDAKAENLPEYYDLVANVTHSSAARTAQEERAWNTHLHLRPPRDNVTGNLREGYTEEDEKWFQIQDLIVEKINRNMVALGESYIQIWERRKQPPIVVETPKPKPK